MGCMLIMNCDSFLKAQLYISNDMLAGGAAGGGYAQVSTALNTDKLP